MRHNPTERIGVNAVERIVIEDLKWIFREQPIVDVGIDVLIEIVDEGNPTGKFIAAQIKSGKGNFTHQKKHLLIMPLIFTTAIGQNPIYP